MTQTLNSTQHLASLTVTTAVDKQNYKLLGAAYRRHYKTFRRRYGAGKQPTAMTLAMWTIRDETSLQFADSKFDPMLTLLQPIAERFLAEIKEAF